MLTAVETRNAQGMTLNLPLQDNAGGYSLLDISGIDPVKASVVTSSYARLDGEVYQSAKRDKRNIIITLQMEPDYMLKTVRDLRTKLYNIFSVKSIITLTFYDDDGSTRTIDGVVESITAPLFSKNAIASISIICPMPDFVDPAVRRFQGNCINRGVQLSYFDVYNYGDIPVGVRVTYANCEGPTNTMYMLNSLGEFKEFPLNAGAQSLVSKTMLFNSEPGKKNITKIINGVSSSALISKYDSGIWPLLMPGLNRVAFGTSYISPNVQPYILEFNERHGGL